MNRCSLRYYPLVETSSPCSIPITRDERSSMHDHPDSTGEQAHDADEISTPTEEVRIATESSPVNASVLKKVEQRNRQKTRRRKPPAWALKVAAFCIASKQFFRHTLPGFLRSRRRELITATVSFLMHIVVGLLMAAWLLPASARNEVLQLIGAKVDESELIENPEELIQIVQPDKIQNLNMDSTMQQMLAELDKGKNRLQIDAPDPGELTLPLDDLAEVPEIPYKKGDFGGRSEAGRRAAVSHFGGTEESEKSVSQGLDWLQKIQQPDGSWSFGKVGAAGQPGSFATTDMGATSMALLCFLGGGNTHKVRGKYQETVHKGLSYLVRNAERGSFGADLRGRFQANSGMYVQGIATICVCEAYAMEREDRDLRRLATDAVKFIERAQNKVDGGWRYNPGDEGDTSVTGWQIMALQSARTGRISVNSSTIRDAKKFLTLVEHNDGAMYGYMPGAGANDTMTAVGLLCRIYLGMKRDDPALKAGVEHLARKGPRRGDIYYNYYATQVLYHWGGDLWTKWNLKMRNELVSSQVKTGPGEGSWNVTDPHGGGGGRIYQTALSILTLEVYYRHLPIYRRFDDKQADDPPEVSAR